MRSGVSFLVRIDYPQVNVAVVGGGRDGLDLLDVEVAVDYVRRIFAPSVISEETRSRLCGQGENERTNHLAHADLRCG